MSFPLPAMQRSIRCSTGYLPRNRTIPPITIGIHWWDERRPENAVASAALNGPAAPAIAHMWHMPGHTYSKLKRFHDAVFQQEASARVDHGYMQRYQVMPYQIHNFAHNNEWCIRNMRTIGRADDALRFSKESD